MEMIPIVTEIKGLEYQTAYDKPISPKMHAKSFQQMSKLLSESINKNRRKQLNR